MSKQNRHKGVPRPKGPGVHFPPARLVGATGATECWMRGRVMFVVPRQFEDLDADVAEAVARRRLAAIQGECPCGGRLHLTLEGPTVEHADDCGATNPELIDRYRRHVDRLQP